MQAQPKTGLLPANDGPSSPLPNPDYTKPVHQWPLSFRLTRGQLIVWLGLAFVVLCPFYLLCNYASPELLALGRRHQTTGGTFVAYKYDHGSIAYSFIVQGVRYRGYGPTGKGIEALEAGEPFTIYYDPRNPNNNVAIAPAQLLRKRHLELFYFFAPLYLAISFLGVRASGYLLAHPDVRMETTNFHFPSSSV